jgi:hypothetical protein
MRRFALVVVAGAVAALVGGGSAFSAAPGPSVTGSGHIHDTRFDPALYRSFSFNAVTKPDGTVSGHVQLDNRAFNGTGIILSVDVDCLEVAGDTAWFSGIASSDDPTYDGQTALFAVKDDGEGRNASPDEITVSNFNGLNCHQSHPAPDFAVENGNVQVRG